MTKYTRKKQKSKIKSRKKRNTNKRTKRRKRFTRKGGIFGKVMDKARGAFDSAKESFKKAKDITNFLNSIPTYNQKILMNKLLTLSLDDSPEELNKLEVQKKKYIDDLYGKKINTKILEKHPLNVVINDNGLSSDKIKEQKSKAFTPKDSKSSIVLLESGPKKTDNGKTYTSQLYAEYKGDEPPVQQNGGRSRKMRGGLKYNQKGGASVDIKSQYVSHTKIGDMYLASDNETTLKTAIDDGKSGNGTEDRDKVGVKNIMPEVESYYVPPMVSKYKSLYENVIKEKDVAKSGPPATVVPTPTDVTPPATATVVPTPPASTAATAATAAATTTATAATTDATTVATAVKKN